MYKQPKVLQGRNKLLDNLDLEIIYYLQFILMKKVKQLLFSSLLCVWGFSGFAQMTTVIDNGVAGSDTHEAGPIYRSSSSSTYYASRYAYLYTQAELASFGILPGHIITSLGWKKSNTTFSNAPAKFRVYLDYTASTDYGASSQPWATLNATAVLSYENLAFLVPATNDPNFMEVTLDVPFVYMGGSISVQTEWDMTGASSPASSGAFSWMTNTIADRSYGICNSSYSGTYMDVLSSTYNSIGYLTDLRPIMKVGYILGTPCNGTPTPGTIQVNASAVCAGESVSLSTSGVSFEMGFAYQWQSSTDGITWANIANATSASANVQVSQNMNFRRRIVCTNSNDTSYTSSVFVSIKPFTDCYCASNATSASYSDITSITYAGITTPTTAACSAYTNNTNIVFNAAINVPSSFSIIADNCSGTSNYSTVNKVYIDLNQNGSFSDPGEMVFAMVSPTSGVAIQGDITIPVGALTGLTGMRVVSEHGSSLSTGTPCGTYTYGETEDYLIQIAPQPANEIKLVSIDSPSFSACTFSNNILTTVKNNGSDTLKNFDFLINLGGLNYPAIAWTGAIAPGATQQVQVPSMFAFNNGDTLSVTVANPNFTPDITSDNNIGFRTYLSLSGNYKVGYGQTNLSIKEFADIETAVQMIYQIGVCDTVYLNIKDGVYSTTPYQLVGNYHNYNSNNLVVFQSESKNAQNVTLEYANTSSINYLVQLNNTRGWSFNHITFKPLGTSYRIAFELSNATSNIYIDSCRFIGSTSTTGAGSYSGSTSAIRSTSSAGETDIYIRDNYFSHFSTAVYMYGSSSSYDKNIFVTNNKMENIFNCPVYLHYVDNFQFEGNSVKMAKQTGYGSSTNYLAYINYSTQFNINRNTFETDTTNSGIYVYYSNSGTNTNKITNNFYYNGSNLHGAFVRVSSSSNGLEIVNNSISTKTNNTTYGVIDIDGGLNIKVLNNNISAVGTQEIFNFSSLSPLSKVNNNNLYKPSGIYVKVGPTNYNSLADWNAASAFDSSSISVNPLFNGADLHTCVSDLKDAGSNYAIGLDIDGDVRTGKPDIGADEFFGITSNFIDQDSIIKCASITVDIHSLVSNTLTYSWAPNGETSSSIVVNTPGTYILNVQSSCGAMADTIVVENIPALTPIFSLAGSYGLAAIIQNTTQNALSYSWNFGDGATSTDKNPTHVYAATGSYPVMLTVVGECETVTSTQIFNAVALSTESLDNGKISLYPNPSQSFLNIQFDNINLGESNIRIIDMSGKIVMSEQYVLNNGSIITLDIAGLTPGIYQVAVISEVGVKQMKFVKQ